MTTVVVVGSVNLDLIVHVPRLPDVGETVLGTDHLRAPGGKGANQAVAVARLGAPSVLLAAVGGDPTGDELRAALAAASVDTTGVVTLPEATTGIAFVVVEEGGSNTITVAPGANRHLTIAPDAVPPSDVLLMQLEIPISTCCDAARRGREHGSRVVLNAAPAPEARDLTELLPLVDVLVANESEARALLHDGSGDAPELALALTLLGPRVAVVTAGSRGASFTADGVGAWQPAFPADAVNPTGAGDAFCGALAVALARGDDLATAVRAGCAAGAIATTSSGAQSALPTRAELDGLLRSVR